MLGKCNSVSLLVFEARSTCVAHFHHEDIQGCILEHVVNDSRYIAETRLNIHTHKPFICASSMELQTTSQTCSPNCILEIHVCFRDLSVETRRRTFLSSICETLLTNTLVRKPQSYIMNAVVPKSNWCLNQPSRRKFDTNHEESLLPVGLSLTPSRIQHPHTSPTCICASS